MENNWKTAWKSDGNVDYSKTNECDDAIIGSLCIISL
jgi:hypothetical protein